MKLVLYTQAYISTSILFDLTKMIQKIKNSSGDHNLLFDLWLVRICAALWAWACRGRCHLSDIFPFLKVSLSNSKYLIFYIYLPMKMENGTGKCNCNYTYTCIYVLSSSIFFIIFGRLLQFQIISIMVHVLKKPNIHVGWLQFFVHYLASSNCHFLKTTIGIYNSCSFSLTFWLMTVWSQIFM